MGDAGRFFEINSSQEVVWEYRNPVGFNTQAQGTLQRDNLTFRAEKYAYNHPAFSGRDLSPGDPIELEPYPYNCRTTGIKTIDRLDFRLTPNPANEWIEVQIDEVEIQMSILNLQGQILIQNNTKRVDISRLPAGSYFIRIQSKNKIGLQAFVKLP